MMVQFVSYSWCRNNNRFQIYVRSSESQRNELCFVLKSQHLAFCDKRLMAVVSDYASCYTGQPFPWHTCRWWADSVNQNPVKPWWKNNFVTFSLLGYLVDFCSIFYLLTYLIFGSIDWRKARVIFYVYFLLHLPWYFTYIAPTHV